MLCSQVVLNIVTCQNFLLKIQGKTSEKQIQGKTQVQYIRISIKFKHIFAFINTSQTIFFSKENKIQFCYMYEFKVRTFFKSVNLVRMRRKTWILRPPIRNLCICIFLITSLIPKFYNSFSHVDHVFSLSLSHFYFFFLGSNLISRLDFL